MNLPDPIQPGLYPDVADAEYRKAVGISQSSLKVMDQSAAHFLAAKSQQKAPTKALVIGRIAHHLLLTPKEPETWVVKPDNFDGRSKEGREWTAANKGREVVTSDDYRATAEAVEAVKAHEGAALALASAQVELSAFAWFERGEERIMRKGRFDCVPCGPAIVDFKFTEDARDVPFSKLIAEAKYYLQAAYYLDLYNANLPAGAELKTAFVFIAIEKTPPYAIATYNLHPMDIELGRQEYELYLTRLIQASATNQWGVYSPKSAYTNDVKTIFIPPYARKQITDSLLA